jgi:endonuclease/exonuclease/phosphatase family metal-dependent hydrolase
MRFLLYNIRYGTGGRRYLLPWSGYLRNTQDNLQAISEFFRHWDPDIAGLVEVDSGSFRTGRTNQAKSLAERLGHYHIYRSKYLGTGIAQHIPIVNKQGNALLCRDSIQNQRFHYFNKGVKRLVIELELENLTVFLVHLALHFRTRQNQLSDLYTLVSHATKPHIVAGDFNSRWGDREIKLFLAATHLTSADPGAQATYPSWAPKRQLDFILHSNDIRINAFHAPRVVFSDHLPLLIDFTIAR